MSTTPVFSSNISQRRWGDHLNNHFIIYINNRPSIFRVPKSVCDTNPEAYAPQQVGIGAYHHFCPDVEMDGRKVEAVKKFLENNKWQHDMFKSLIVDRVKELEPSIRSCYNKYLDLDSDTLAWIMAIDGVYLLHLLSTYSGIHFEDRDLIKDIFMLENQLPCIVLKEIIKKAEKEIKNALQPPDEEDKDKGEGKGEDEVEIKVEGEGEDEVEIKVEDENMIEVKVNDDKELFSEMMSCKAHSPLDLKVNPRSLNDTTSPHLLSYMHSLVEIEVEDKDEVEVEVMANYLSKLIHDLLMMTFCKEHSPLDLKVNQRSLNDTTSPHLLGYMYSLVMHSLEMHDWPSANMCTRMAKEVTDKFLEAAKLAAKMSGQKDLIFLANLPLQQFFDLLKKDNPTTDSSIEKIKIPSASQLQKVCKVEFLVWPESGNGVKYLTEPPTLFMPVIKLNTDSEVILRNLVAYEVASGSNDVVSGFVDFMCGLIDTAEDVDLLKKKKIINSKLPSQEIAKMFNRITKSNRMSTDLAGTTEQLNSVYDNSFRVKAPRFIKSHCVPSETTVKLILSILVIGLLSLQAFCQVYGCSTHWFGSFGKINSILSNPQVETLGISPE